MYFVYYGCLCMFCTRVKRQIFCVFCWVVFFIKLTRNTRVEYQTGLPVKSQVFVCMYVYTIYACLKYNNQ